MAGTDLFTHIRYMTYTTIPSIVITLVVFLFLGFFQAASGEADTLSLLNSIDERFTINLGLFIVPAVVIFMIIRKAPPLVALLTGTLLGGGFALLYQPHLVLETAGATQMNFTSAYRGIMNAITVDNAIVTSNDLLNDLFTSGGMQGMLGTIWLIICAMVFGGVMDAIGGLQKLSQALLAKAESTFQLFAGTAASCVTINLTASDQYLSIVLPGKCSIRPTRTVTSLQKI